MGPVPQQAVGTSEPPTLWAQSAADANPNSFFTVSGVVCVLTHHTYSTKNWALKRKKNPSNQTEKKYPKSKIAAKKPPSGSR